MTVAKRIANKIGFLLALGGIGLAWTFWAFGFQSAQTPTSSGPGCEPIFERTVWLNAPPVWIGSSVTIG